METMYLLKGKTTWTSQSMFQNIHHWNKMNHWKIAKRLAKAKETQDIELDRHEVKRNDCSRTERDELINNSRLPLDATNKGFESIPECQSQGSAIVNSPAQTEPSGNILPAVQQKIPTSEAAVLQQPPLHEVKPYDSSCVSDNKIPSKHHICDTCQKVCSCASALQRHMRRHTGEKPFQCQHCGKNFGWKSGLAKHIRLHTGELPSYSCDLCDKTYTQKSALTLHIRTHTGELPSYSCDLCDKTYTQKSALTLHMRIHSGERQYTCDQCDYTTAWKSALTIHMRRHSGERPFPCQHCDMKFCEKGALTAHIRTHDNTKRYGCQACGERFDRHGEWTRHFRGCYKSSTVRCNSFNCKCCKLIGADRIRLVNGLSVPFTPGNCSTESIVYLVVCKLCSKSYFGRATDELCTSMTIHGSLFNKVLNNEDIRTREDSSLGEHLVHEHDCRDKDDFDKHYQVHIVEKFSTLDSEKKDHLYIQKFKTQYPLGLNKHHLS